MQPNHYGNGMSAYRTKAMEAFGCKCADCDTRLEFLLEVHHVDGDRTNNELNNLEVVCANHHKARHLKKRGDGWVWNSKYITSREDLEEILKDL